MELEDIIRRSKRIVFFGGAGVSTASGIPDFRSADGLYNAETGADGGRQGPSPEDILSATYFALHTKEFYDFYRAHMVYPDAQPNACHRYLYELEKQDKLRAIVTQNIDGLHKRAGNKRVYELHGSVYENYCVHCEAEYPLEKIMETDGVPRCDRCGGIIKPWVVLYGEAPDKYTMIGACREISGADLMIVAGTSLSVEPAASLIENFSGKALVVINKEATPADERATLVIRDDVASVFAALENSHK
ncbi:MAG: NAD-dependent protein deacylase [Firmicutes bacterium]|nr:NAD-dependent protein deacylase [Bacillota bacterium]